MKKLLILGAGTGGTMMLNKFHKALDPMEWEITIVDHIETHFYQPGFLFIPFGIYKEEDVIRPKRDFFPKNVNVIMEEIDKIVPKENKVYLKEGTELIYDYLIIATGSEIAPEETEGLKGDLWYNCIFDFYTIEGAMNLAWFFEKWEGGKLVINITEFPIKCPVAPLEFAFLADWYFTEKKMRDKVEIHFVTPLSSAFTKEKCAEVMADYLTEKNIKTTVDFSTGRVDNENKKIISWDEMEVPFDCLVTVPTNKGNSCIERSGMGDELNFIPTDKYTLQSKDYENIFVIGDATDLPSSKAGSVVHFQSEVLFENIMSLINGKEMKAKFDGHANCFIESGFGKALLIDFNYETEPLKGSYPLPVLGPFKLLQETRMNHFGKLLFKWTYWNLLLKGRELPVSNEMTMTGKQIDEEKE